MPPEDRKARGTYRADRDPTAGMVQRPPGMPSTPRGMPVEARQLWRKIAKKLLAAGLLSDMDGTTLERYCRAYALWRGLMAAAEAVDIKAGAEARKWEREVLTPLGASLGLNYAARSRMRAPAKSGETDPVEEDLFGDVAQLKAIEGGKT